MKYLKYLILLVFVPPLFLGIVGVLFTMNKIEKMEQIRGWRPGATVRMEVVRQKVEDPNSGTCWIAFTDESIHRAGPHRMNLQPEAWDRLRIGELIEVVYLPGSPKPYTRGGIFASDGNFAFDRALLVIEFVVIGVSILGTMITIGVFVFLGFRSRRKAALGPSRG